MALNGLKKPFKGPHSLPDGFNLASGNHRMWFSGLTIYGKTYRFRHLKIFSFLGQICEKTQLNRQSFFIKNFLLRH